MSLFGVVAPVSLVTLHTAAPGASNFVPLPSKQAKPVVTGATATHAFIASHCLDCHDSETKKGGLDLATLPFDLTDARNFATWVKVHDRVANGEMPPKTAQLPLKARHAFAATLTNELVAAEGGQLGHEGRAVWRRLNRYEYENTLRDVLHAPWLQLKDMLPEDGEAYRFNKVGEALDVSHVQMARYLNAADYALHQVMATQAERPASTVQRFYTREEGAFSGAYNVGPEVRSTFPVLGSQPDQEHKTPPLTVGASDPARRDQEGVGVVLSTYEPTEIHWGHFKAPVAGHYKLRICANTIWIGPKSDKEWWVPNYANISAGRRTEPILVYSDRTPRLLRKLGQFDAQPDAKVQEIDTWLLQGESIRPDAVRFFRPRPGDMHNPWATVAGQPGVSFRWLEVEGPLYDQWPTVGHKLLFGALPLKQVAKDHVEVVSTDPQHDAARLLRNFVERTYRRPVTADDVARFLPVVSKALEAGYPFQEALLASYKAVLCSPAFLYLDEKPGRLDAYALASRLSYLLWNSPPDDQLLALAASGELRQPAVLRAQTNRMLDDEKSRRFVDAFLDYWLDLRKLNANDADVLLYPDYQLDDLLVDSSLRETQEFFGELLRQDLPVKNIVDSDWAMLNERLAQHYGVPGDINGVALRRVGLPSDSPRGGLLTQASILKVTANGTTTSPVLRGAWIMERILGEPSPPPPPGVGAIEPDTRGATTIREQLDKHRASATCATCHKNIDPAGFALENFDVMGGWRDAYRALGDGGGKFQKAAGYGHNGDHFTFSTGLPVDAHGELPHGGAFKDVRELKKLLGQNDRKLALNLTKQLLIYATGTQVRFADRPQLATMLDRAKPSGYGVRTLVHQIVQSELFQTK